MNFNLLIKTKFIRQVVVVSCAIGNPDFVSDEVILILGLMMNAVSNWHLSYYQRVIESNPTMTEKHFIFD